MTTTEKNQFREFILSTIEKEIGTEVYEEQTDAEPQGDCWLADASLKTAIAAFEKVAAHAFKEGRKAGLKDRQDAERDLASIAEGLQKTLNQ